MACKILLLSLGLLLGAACAATPSLSSDDGAAASFDRIIIAGDSTASDYPPERTEQAGWGQALPYFVDDDVEVINLAVSGRSTKSYTNEGKWDALMGRVGAGDLVMISFGHNDARDDVEERYAPPLGAFKDNMIGFAREVDAAGASPLILTPAARRLWEGGAMVETHGLYAFASKAAAQETPGYFIDLSNRSIDYFEQFGREDTKKDFLWVTRNHWKTGALETLEDNTHFSYLGACGVAFVIANELGKMEATAGLVKKSLLIVDDVPNQRPKSVVECAAQLEQKARR